MRAVHFACAAVLACLLTMLALWLFLPDDAPAPEPVVPVFGGDPGPPVPA